MQTITDSSTRAFERHDPAWHSRVEDARSAEEVVTLMRDYVASLTPEQLGQLPDRCRPLRVKAEDDLEYWTFRLSSLRDAGQPEAEFVQDLFMHFLHASLRITQLHRERAARCHEPFADGM
jgi:hypothetical protein